MEIIKAPRATDAPVASKAGSKLHLTYLDGLRALAMLWVLSNHVVSIALLNNQGPYWRDTPHWLRGPLSVLLLGHYAVDIFIALSGFCLALPVVRSGVLKGSAWAFYKRRARRILPPYYASIAVAILLGWVSLHLTGDTRNTSSGWALTPWGVITHLLLIHDLFRATIHQISGVLWSVAVEWRIYFLFPLLVWAWRRWGIAPATGGAVVFGWLLFRMMKHLSLRFSGLEVMENTGVGSCPHYIALFAMGAAGAMYAFSPAPVLARLRSGSQTLWAALVLCIAVALVTAAVMTGRPGHVATFFGGWERRDYLVGACATALMIAAGLRPLHWAFRPLSWRPLVGLGTFTYSAYLIHGPVLTLIYAMLRPLHLSAIGILTAGAVIGAPIALGAAYLFHLGFERPFMGSPAPKTERQAEMAAVTAPAF